MDVRKFALGALTVVAAILVHFHGYHLGYTHGHVDGWNEGILETDGFDLEGEA